MTDKLPNPQVLNYFETVLREFITERLSNTENWWNACIPPEVREDTTKRYEAAKKSNDLLNKQDYTLMQYLNFDNYGRIIARRDNWRNYFEEVFLEKTLFEYKIRIIQSLRNDVRHARPLNHINRLRLRLHCYDILSQIYESGKPGADGHDVLTKKLDLEE